MIRVVIADDEKLSRSAQIKMVRRYLTGCDVREAENGQELLEYMRHSAADLIITDIRMPVLDGLEAARQIREFNRNVPIVIVSGYDDFVYAKRAIKYNVNDYLLKPIDPDELKTVLYRILESTQDRMQPGTNNDAYKEACSYYRNLLLENETYTDPPAGFRGEYYYVLDTYLLDLAINYNFFNALNVINYIQTNGQKQYPCATFELRAGEIVCVVNTGVKNSDMISGIFEDVVKKLNLYIGLSLQFGFSGSAMVQKDVKSAYDRAHQALMLRIYDNKKMLLSYQELSGRKPGGSYWDSVEPDLIEKIAKEDSAGCLAVVEAVFAKAKTERIEPQCLIDWLIRILVNIQKRIAPKCGNAPELVEPEIRRFETVCKCQPLPQIEESYYGVLHLMLDLIRDYSMGDDTKIIEKAKRYICSGKGVGITLRSCADYICLSPAYFSYMFRKETGVKFVDFLTDVKLDWGRKLLIENPELRIFQISNQLGYNDVKYFNRVFKRKYHLSPSEYRLQEKESGWSVPSPDFDRGQPPDRR